MWRITSIINRYDGLFAFLRRDEGNKVVMKYIRLDRKDGLYCHQQDENVKWYKLLPDGKSVTEVKM